MLTVLPTKKLAVGDDERYADQSYTDRADELMVAYELVWKLRLLSSSFIIQKSQRNFIPQANSLYTKLGTL